MVNKKWLLLLLIIPAFFIVMLTIRGVTGICPCTVLGDMIFGKCTSCEESRKKSEEIKQAVEKMADEEVAEDATVNDVVYERSSEFPWTDGRFVINDMEFVAPFGVEAFVKSGFSVSPMDASLDILKPDEIAVYSAVLDKIYITLTVRNNTNEDIEAIKADAFSVSCDSSDCVFSNGIKTGMSTDEVIEILGKPNVMNTQDHVTFMQYLCQSSGCSLSLSFVDGDLSDYSCIFDTAQPQAVQN